MSEPRSAMDAHYNRSGQICPRLGKAFWACGRSWAKPALRAAGEGRRPGPAQPFAKGRAVEPTVTPALRAELGAGFAAGIAGGLTIEVALLGPQLASGASAGTLVGNFAFVAATLLGPSAYANPAAVPIGVVLHFGVAIGWALGYVYLARTQRQLLVRPWISGAAFGLMVYIFMQIVLLTAGQYHRPMPRDLAIQLIAHIVFYGIPVALIAANMLRRTANAATTPVDSGRAG